MPEENKSCPSFRTMIGGQALIEGIMMMGPDKKSIVVRKPDGELEIPHTGMASDPGRGQFLPVSLHRRHCADVFFRVLS